MVCLFALVVHGVHVPDDGDRVQPEARCAEGHPLRLVHALHQLAHGAHACPLPLRARLFAWGRVPRRGERPRVCASLPRPALPASLIALRELAGQAVTVAGLG